MAVYMEVECEGESGDGGRMRLAVIKRGHGKSHLGEEKAFSLMLTAARFAT